MMLSAGIEHAIQNDYTRSHVELMELSCLHVESLGFAWLIRSCKTDFYLWKGKSTCPEIDSKKTREAKKNQKRISQYIHSSVMIIVKAQTIQPPLAINASQAMAALNVSKTGLASLIRQNKIHVVDGFKRNRLFSMTSILQFLDGKRK